MSTPSNFFHAHCHSQYSPLDAMSNVGKLVDKAVRYKQPALALTDHGLMSGAVQLYKACKAAGIKPFIGIETYLIDPLASNWDTPDKGQKIDRYHVGLLALNEDGYKALVQFSSQTHTRPRFNRFARCTASDLKKLGAEHGDNIALTTGCYFGLAQQYYVQQGQAGLESAIEFYKTMFKHTFVEAQHHNIIHDDGLTDDELVKALFQAADKLGLPIIATQDAHYLDQADKKAHELMKKMSYGGADDSFPGDCFHLASTDWVQEHYSDEQWAKVEKGCAKLLALNDISIRPLDTYTIDVPDVPGIPDPVAHIASVCDARLNELLKTKAGADPKAYRARLKMELGVINELNMPGYFCIWENFVQWCRNKEIAVEARGSANGSLVCYLIGVTQVDPVEWGTDFTRFMGGTSYEWEPSFPKIESKG